MVAREDILKYANISYNTKSERLWTKFPGYEVLRHNRNKKWYALIANVSRNKIGLSGEELIDILNVKCDPDMVAVLSSQKGIIPAYHMNKRHWITIILDGTVSDQEIYHLLDLSYEITKSL